MITGPEDNPQGMRTLAGIIVIWVHDGDVVVDGVDVGVVVFETDRELLVPRLKGTAHHPVTLLRHSQAGSTGQVSGMACPASESALPRMARRPRFRRSVLPEAARLHQ